MEAINTVPTKHTTPSPNSSPSSVLDRKRELKKSIPGSFSYNLGHRNNSATSPPNIDTARAAGDPGRSVKSIVAWIESSAANEGSSPSPSRLSANSGSDFGWGGSGTVKSSPSSYKLLHHGGGGSFDESPSRQQYKFKNVDLDADSNCPTFLSYQRYYTQPSLTRCLDGLPSTKVVVALEHSADVQVGKIGGVYEKLNNETGDCNGHETNMIGKRSSTEVRAL